MKTMKLAGLAIFLLCFCMVDLVNAAIVFEDNFDVPDQTNSQWMIFDFGYTPAPEWDFVSIPNSYPGDLGYRADTFDYSQQNEIGPTASFAQNGMRYETNNLTVSTLIRIDAPDINPYNSAVEGSLYLADSVGNSYGFTLQVDYEGTPTELDFGFVESVMGTSQYLLRPDLTGKLDYGIFYCLAVQIDSDGYFDILLTNDETGEQLVNIFNFEPNVHFDSVLVGLGIDGKGTFNDFYLEGNPVPIPGAVLLFGSGLIGLIGVRRKIRS